MPKGTYWVSQIYIPLLQKFLVAEHKIEDVRVHHCLLIAVTSALAWLDKTVVLNSPNITLGQG